MSCGLQSPSVPAASASFASAAVLVTVNWSVKCVDEISCFSVNLAVFHTQCASPHFGPLEHVAGHTVFLHVVPLKRNLLHAKLMFSFLSSLAKLVLVQAIVLFVCAFLPVSSMYRLW